MNLIQTLFKILILEESNKKNWPEDLDGWADSYAAILVEIQRVKKQIEGPESKGLNVEEHRSFLYRWLNEHSNGISSKGQSIISGDKFKNVIEDAGFLDTFKRYLVDPNLENYNSIKGKWKETVKVDNAVIYNRAAAAVNTNLTCVVHETKFYQVIRYLQQNVNYQENITYNWYEDNINLTKWLDDQLSDYKNDFSTKIKKKDSAELWPVWRNIFVWVLFGFNPGMFELKKNIVKYGPPGTGKTYTCKIDAANHFALWKGIYRPEYSKNVVTHTETIQFHPSFTYEDFMEGIKPVLNEQGKSELKLVNGIFKSICKKAASWEMDIYRLMADRDWNKQPFSDLRIKEIKDKLSGERWTFLSELEDNDDNNPKYVHDYIPPFYLIIDEINRAELSRVMGELMLCLEYRGLAGKIKTQYGYLSKEGEETDFWRVGEDNYFFVPNNLFILATMNTIDRSVESFDFALRRRFRWLEVPPDYEVLSQYLSNKKVDDNGITQLVKGLVALNDQIASHALLGKDFQIGHAYFMNLPEMTYKMKVKDFKNEIWSNFIQPLLEEYLRGTGEIDGEINKLKTSFGIK